MKKFTLKFNQEKETKKSYFLKANGYFITSFTCFIKHDVTEHKNYKKNLMNSLKYVEIFYLVALTLGLI